MSDTFLQDFGLLRKQANAREVHDPMSGSARWEDLQMDLRKPHIPKPRRDNVPANRSLTIGGVTIGLKADVSGEVTTALGFVSKGSYKHRLVTMKSDNYRRIMADNHVKAAEANYRRLVSQDNRRADTKLRQDNMRSAIRALVRKARHNPLPSVSDVYRRHIRTLWPYRGVTGFLPRQPKQVVVPKPIAVAPKPKTQAVIPPSALAEFEDIRSKLAGMDVEDKARVALILRQQELHRLMWGNK